MFFWTAQRLTDPQRKKLSVHFSKWLTRKYGSTQKAWDDWGKGSKGRDKFDAPTNGMIGCLPIDNLTLTPESPAYTKRLRDTVQFLAEFHPSGSRAIENGRFKFLPDASTLSSLQTRTGNRPPASDSNQEASNRGAG